jgi:ADP-ribosylglycohydrolase
MDDREMLSKIQGCLLGVAIGDAMGMPVEMMTRAEILAATDGRPIAGFVNPLAKKIPSLSHHRAGQTTDDWQLTRAVARSLIRRKRFDLVDQALALVDEFEKTTAGWGRATSKSAISLKSYFNYRGDADRSPFDPLPQVPGQGGGNGVAMKIAPLAVIDFLQGENLSTAIDLSFLTHSDPRASVAAAVMEGAIFAELVGATNDRRSVVNDAVYVETELLKDVVFPQPTLSDNLRHVLVFQSVEDALAAGVKNGCLAIDSIPFALLVFFEHRDDFRAGVLAAVNAGGDTDTNASMVGALIGARLGVDGIPEEWRKFNPAFAEAFTLGEELFKSFKR